MQKAENDVEYAELSMAHDMALQAPSSRLGTHRTWDPSSEPLDEHVMLLHLFELQDRQATPSNTYHAWNKPTNFKRSSRKPESKKFRTKSSIESLDFNLGATPGSSSNNLENTNPLDLPSTSAASSPHSSNLLFHPTVVSACMKNVLSLKCRPREETTLSKRGTSSENKWSEQTVPLRTNSQGDICPLEILFQSINFDSEPEQGDSFSRQALKLPPLRSPSPPRTVPVPVSEPSRDATSAFSWTPSLLANRKLPKSQEEAGTSSETIRKNNTRSPDRPKSS